MNSTNLQDIRSTHNIQFYFHTLAMYNTKIISTTIPFMIASKRIKYLRVNLTEEVKDLHTKNCKTSLKGIKEDLNEWEERMYSWVGNLILLKWQYNLK